MLSLPRFAVSILEKIQAHERVCSFFQKGTLK